MQDLGLCRQKEPGSRLSVYSRSDDLGHHLAILTLHFLVCEIDPLQQIL